MDVLIYLVVLFAVSAALVSLSYVWYSALRDALRARAGAAGDRDAGWFWPLLIVALGWLGALLYWSSAAHRQSPVGSR